MIHRITAIHQYVNYFHNQMTARLYASISIVLLAYLAYCWYTYDPMFNLRNFKAEAVEVFTPVYAPPPTAHAEAQRIVEPPSHVPHKEENAYDSEESSYESAQIPERLRHPERSFSPGYVNDETGNAVASGVASYSAGVTKQAEQLFGPEFVQNGGQFMEGGIIANDESGAVSYSSI